MRRKIQCLFLILVILLLIQPAFSQEIIQTTKESNLEKIKGLLEKDPGLVNFKDKRNCTPLHYASSRGKIEIVKYLISKGADLSARDVDGDTPLHWAATDGHLDIIKLLIGKGADFDSRNNRNKPPFYWAVVRGHPDVMEYFLGKNVAYLTEKDNVGYTYLHWAAITGKPESAEFLINKGADINERKNWKDLSVVHVAVMFARKNQDKLVKLFLKNGIKLDTKGDAGISLLLEAAASGVNSLVEYILSKGVNVNAQDKYGLTALHKAAWGGKKETVDLLINKGSKIDDCSKDGRRPIDMAGNEGHEEVVELLTIKGSDGGPRKFPELTGEYLGMKNPGLKPEIFAPGIVSTEHREHSNLTFSPQGDELYYCIQYRTSQGYKQHLFMMKQEEGRWKPRERPPFISKYSSGGGSFSPDGKRFYFHSTRPVKKGGKPLRVPDIWVTERGATGWNEAAHLGSLINTELSEVTPNIVQNNIMYFSATDKNRNTDIYRSEFINGQFTKPVNLGSPVNTAQYESVSYVAMDESYIIFYQVDRSQGVADLNLMISFRKEMDSWTKPVSLKDRLNLKGTDILAAKLSPDKKYLFILDDMDFYWCDAKVIDNIKGDVFK
jgi:ankyrin repeat protein